MNLPLSVPAYYAVPGSASRQLERHEIRHLYWTAFTIRLVLGSLAWVVTAYGGLDLIADAGAYSQRAAWVAQYWLSGQQSPWLTGAMASGKEAWGIVVLLAMIYCLTAGVEVVPLALVLYCLVTSLSVVYAYRAARALGAPHGAALLSGKIIVWSPAFAIWSAALYKEGLILVVLFLLVEQTLLLQQSFQLRSILILAACLIALYSLRFYLGALLTVTILAGLLFPRSARSPTPGQIPAFVRQTFLLVLIIGCFSLVGISDRAQKLLSAGLDENLQKINISRQDLASNRSGYLRNFDVSTTEGAVSYLPMGLVYFLTLPLPWHIGSMRQNLTIPETLFWIVVLYPLVVKGAWRAARQNPQGVLFLVITSVTICCFYAIFSANIGTTYRMRIQVWALWALFAGWGWYRPPRPALPMRRQASAGSTSTSRRTIRTLSNTRPASTQT